MTNYTYPTYYFQCKFSFNHLCFSNINLSGCFVLVSRFPRSHHVVAGGRDPDDRAHRVGGQGWDGPVLWRPAGDPTGDRRHRGGTDGLTHQPAQGTHRAGFVWLYEVKRFITAADIKLCVCADGPSLSGLHLILQLGPTLLQRARCFPPGECLHPSDFIKLLCSTKDEKFIVCVALLWWEVRTASFNDLCQV